MNTDIPEKLGGFTIHEYPQFADGSKFVVVERSSEAIGGCYIVKDGFKVVGHSNTVTTLLLAIKQMIDDKINEARASEARWKKMMQTLSKECGPIV